VPLWELLAKGKVWQEIYRTAVIAERKADAEIQRRQARRARMRQMMGKR
jgi:hypothetical protein